MSANANWTNPQLDIDRIIDDRRTRIIVCCGSGGVEASEQIGWRVCGDPLVAVGDRGRCVVGAQRV